MPYKNNICYQVQKAGRLYLRDLADDDALSFLEDTDHIYQGLSALTLENTRVVTQCLRVDPSPTSDFEGTWVGKLRIYLYENADDVTEDDFHSHAGELFSKFMLGPETIAGLISAALPDFTTQIAYPAEQGWGIKDRTWFAYLDMLLDGCCGSDLNMA